VTADSVPTAPDAGEPPADQLREQLLEAAAKVFADRGFSGAKVMDIVREAGLSSGALYGRFASKNELLTEAVIEFAIHVAAAVAADRSVNHVIEQFVTHPGGPLTDEEAMHLEAYVTARREPDVADALAEGRRRRGEALDLMVEQAIASGLVDATSDTESTLYFLDTMSLGLLLQRAAGVAPPDLERWQQLVRKLLATAAGPSGPSSPPDPSGPSAPSSVRSDRE